VLTRIAVHHADCEGMNSHWCSGCFDSEVTKVLGLVTFRNFGAGFPSEQTPIFSIPRREKGIFRHQHRIFLIHFRHAPSATTWTHRSPACAPLPSVGCSVDVSVGVAADCRVSVGAASNGLEVGGNRGQNLSPGPKNFSPYRSSRRSAFPDSRG